MTKNLKGLLDKMTTEIMDPIPVNENGEIELHLVDSAREKIKKSLSQAFSLGQQSTLQEVEEEIKEMYNVFPPVMNQKDFHDKLDTLLSALKIKDK